MEMVHVRVTIVLALQHLASGSIGCRHRLSIWNLDRPGTGWAQLA
jgi:hypothetical protein